MTENEKLARLNEMGKEIAGMYPDLHGSMSFNFQDGKYTGKAKMDLCMDTSRTRISGGYGALQALNAQE